MDGAGGEEGSQEKRGTERHWVRGSRLSSPKHWFVESEITSDRVATGLVRKEPGRVRSLSLANSSRGKPAPCTKQPPPRAGGGDRQRPRQQRKLARVCLLPLGERKKAAIV